MTLLGSSTLLLVILNRNHSCNLSVTHFNAIMRIILYSAYLRDTGWISGSDNFFVTCPVHTGCVLGMLKGLLNQGESIALWYQIEERRKGLICDHNVISSGWFFVCKSKSA